MKSLLRLLSCLCCHGLLLAALLPTVMADESSTPPASAKPDFEREIQPLLLARCAHCHGAETQESRFRVDRRSALLRGGDSGEPAIIPGNSADSHLIQLVTGVQAGQLMPPEGEPRLTEQEVRLLRSWIDHGAEWPGAADDPADQPARSDHWSFQPVVRVTPPAGSHPWIANPIDTFILQKLEALQIAPGPEASRPVLIRRLYLDMLGLPPTPEEVAAFVADTAPAAWPRLVDQVLASPHYGERWARYWLDLVRFAETNGFETNRERPNAWPYRDYVIRALNDDKPYDQFLKEQLAGDALGVPEATAYLVAGPYDLVKSPDINLTLMQRQNELDDMINTTGTAFLGLTMGCARCHNHKFDPIRQTDYYAWQAIFAGVGHGDRSIPLPTATIQTVQQLDRRIQELRQQLVPFLKNPALAGRPPVNARLNEELFAAIPARYVRFTIRRTNASQPCLDELEIFSDGRNVALAADGAVPTCSSSLPGYAIHQLQHINDGRYGNSRSWISNEAGGWVQIQLPAEFSIDRIVWGRDREGQFSDRVATDYVIEAATEPGQWTVIASSADRRPFSTAPEEPPTYDFTRVPADQAAAALQWHAELQNALQTKDQLLAAATVYAGTFQQPGPTYRLFRGEPSAQREQVHPGTVAALGSLDLTQDTPEQQRRLALASWIASPDNPLTARVQVNRMWQFHFGRGLVATPSDFGAAGVRPTHPELLDWLAAELMNHGWSLKHVHRLILLSATWRQSSVPRSDALAVDAATEWWWRFPPRRLEAEPIRDSILSVAGSLDRRMFGPGFSAFEIDFENVRHYFPKKSYGPADWRRMIYMTKVRQEQDSVFGILDCPDASTSVPRRSRSTTPLQALNLLNSDFMLQQSALFAARLQRDAGSAPAEQIRRAYALCFSRPPEDDELAAAAAFIARHSLTDFCRALLNSNEFVFLQ